MWFVLYKDFTSEATIEWIKVVTRVERLHTAFYDFFFFGKTEILNFVLGTYDKTKAFTAIIDVDIVLIELTQSN